MKFDDLDWSTRQSFQAIVSYFTSKKIREEQIWTSEQLIDPFLSEMKGRVVEDPRLKWFFTPDGRDFSKRKIEQMIKKRWRISARPPSLENKLNIGHGDEVYNIYWGRIRKIYKKDPIRDIKTSFDDLEKVPYEPWTIRHINDYLSYYHDKELPEILSSLSNSPIEESFYLYWLDHFYGKDNNPGLFPQVNIGEIFSADGQYYQSREEVRFRPSRTVTPRFDFCVINVEKQKKLIIELDGHQYHHRKKDRIRDSVKRTAALRNGWIIQSFTGSQIYRNIQSCFESIKDFLTSP